MKPHIAIVDDNPRFLAGLLKAIAANADDLLVSTLQTATEFEDRLPELVREPPHVFVLDVMLKWTAETRGTTELFKDGFRPLDGGFFVASAIRRTAGLESVPIVFYSASPTTEDAAALYLNKEHRTHVFFASKNLPDDQVAKLLVSIVSAQVDVKPAMPRRPNLLDAVELKPGAFGFRIDLKKLFRGGKSDA